MIFTYNLDLAKKKRGINFSLFLYLLVEFKN